MFLNPDKISCEEVHTLEVENSRSAQLILFHGCYLNAHSVNLGDTIHFQTEVGFLPLPEESLEKSVCN